jgi:hypothetical protein
VPNARVGSASDVTADPRHVRFAPGSGHPSTPRRRWLRANNAPGLPPLHLYLATNYVGLGEIEKARAAMAEAQRVGPEFAECHLTGAFAGADRERQWLFSRIAAGLEDRCAAEALR